MSISDHPTGPKDAKSTVLTIEEEVCCLLSAYTAAAGRLPLRLVGNDPEPDTLITAPLLATARHQPVVRRDRGQGTEKRKLHLHLGINRTSKFAFVQLLTKANRVTASAFLAALIKAVPYKIHSVGGASCRAVWQS